MTTMTMTEVEAADRLREAEDKRDTYRTRLTAARADLATLTATIAATREAYRAALAQAELTGGVLPSRTELADLLGLVPEAEDRVAALERALAEVEREWREAKAATLEQQAAALRSETQERQARIHALESEVNERQQEISAHGSWIQNRAVEATRLDAEALRMRRGV
jgi:chromosome segregation ATPase